MADGEISFGRFRLDLARRELRRDQTTGAAIWHWYKQRYETQQASLQTARPEPLSVTARRSGLLRPF
jgi:hypothetical protein